MTRTQRVVVLFQVDRSVPLYQLGYPPKYVFFVSEYRIYSYANSVSNE